VALANKKDIEDQLKLVDDYCRKNDLKVDKYFCDNGVSGLTVNREGLNALFDVLQRGDIVVVKDVARLSRSTSKCITLVEKMERYGVTLKVIN
jgi:DNA invertase Pin-like site-specific DNA recombinase